MATMQELRDWPGKSAGTGGRRAGKTTMGATMGAAIGGQLRERRAALAYIRKVAQEGTADDEFKLNRLADAIERGEHE